MRTPIEPFPVPDLSPIFEWLERTRESVRRSTMLEFQHENVGKPLSTAVVTAQKISPKLLTYKG